jgi:hypothetical protein
MILAVLHYDSLSKTRGFIYLIWPYCPLLKNSQVYFKAGYYLAINKRRDKKRS